MRVEEGRGECSFLGSGWGAPPSSRLAWRRRGIGLFHTLIRVNTIWIINNNNDTCSLLFKTHQCRPYRQQPGDTHWPSPDVRCRWIIPCQCWHLVLEVPSKAMIIAKGPWYPWSFNQALSVPRRNMLILIPNLGRTKRLDEDRGQQALTSSRIHRLEKLQYKLP